MRFPIRPTAALLALLSGAGALAACGGGSALSTCGAPNGQVALVYPAPGSTGIPDNFPGVVFGSSHGLPASYTAILQQSGTTLMVPQFRLQPAPVPLPTPDLIPSFPNPVYQISAPIKTLAGGTEYQVFLYDGNKTCTPSYVGAFTAQ